MRTTLAVLVCLMAVHCSFAQTRRQTPEMCQGAVMRGQFGYNPHPTDCNQFVQCFYHPKGRVEPVFQRCRFGEFWDHSKLRCGSSELVNCRNDKCKSGLMKFWKHSNPDQCGAYWGCSGGVSQAKCCDPGFAFNPTRGCVRDEKCKDMCPFYDRVPGCDRRPVIGSPMKYEQYTDNGRWRVVDCPKSMAYSQTECECSIEGLMVAGRICQPDLKLTFEKGLRDESGKNTPVTAKEARLYNGAAYFNGRASINVGPFPAVPGGSTDLVVKLRYRDDPRYASLKDIQPILTNGHCGKNSSIFIGKNQEIITLGANANTTAKLELPVVKGKVWKEIIYIHDGQKLEGRVCGASDNTWSFGPLKETGCGLQFGNVNGMRGFTGMLDDIEVYRCIPLETVINIGY